MRASHCFGLAWALGVMAVGGLTGCDGVANSPPRIQWSGEQTFQVDVGGTVRIEVEDDEGDTFELRFALDPEPPSLVAGAPGAPRFEPIGGGALLSWTPTAADAGEGEARYRAQVEATDEHGASSLRRFDITVISAPPPPTPLRFAAPAGAGVLLTGECLDALPIEVLGAPAPLVTIEVDTPAGRCDGLPDCQPLRLSPDGPGAQKTLDWCPTPAQHADTVQHGLRLQARSLAGDAAVSKRFFVRFHREADPGCGGDPPVIEHSPPDPVEGPLDYVITADIADDLGIKVAPVLAFAVDPPEIPADPRGVEGWQAVEFTRAESERWPNRWQAAIPNLNLEPGAQASIHYAIYAVDDDDEVSSACDRSAAAGLFTLQVSGGDEAGPAYPPCTPCRADAQCGGADDRCALLFDSGFCAAACVDQADCGADELCAEVATVDGPAAFLCLPADQNCGQLCEADRFEMQGNDAPEAAVPIEPGPQEALTLCDEDEDWFTVPIRAGDAVVVQATFDGRLGDLDLGLQLPGEGALEHQSLGGGGDVEIVREPCAPEDGRAIVAVWAYAGRVGPYALEVDVGPGDCDVPCVADRYESLEGGNDTRATAAEVALPFDSGRLTICREDHDFYAVRPGPGQLLRADLQLQEERLAGDLGLRLWRGGVLVDESAAFRPAEAVSVRTGLDERYVIEVFGQSPRSVNTYTLHVEALDGMPCDAERPCPQGFICSDGICVDDLCRADADCGADQVCVTPRLGQLAEQVGGRCADRCRTSRDCRRNEGLACKPLGNKSVCLIEGAQPIGQRCGRHEACAGDAACLDLPGGYCGRVGCDPCPDGSACAVVDGIGACLRACDGPEDCRVAEQYLCQVSMAAALPVCLPAEP